VKVLCIVFSLALSEQNYGSAMISPGPPPGSVDCVGRTIFFGEGTYSPKKKVLSPKMKKREKRERYD